MTKYASIPSTIEEVTQRLEGLDALLTAKEWEKAAIVYAFTYEGRPGPRSVKNVTDLYTITDFAKEGIVGLESKPTVIFYRNCWKKAIEDGVAPDGIVPGDRVELPSVEAHGEAGKFPPIPRGTDGYASKEGAKKTIGKIVAKHGEEILADAAEDDDAVADAAANTAAKPKVAKKIARTPKATKPLKDARAEVQDEVLEQAGISRQQRAARKEELKTILRRGAESAIAEWNALPPSERGEMSLSWRAMAVHGEAETFLKFVGTPEEEDFVWGDPEHVASIVDIIDEAIQYLEDAKTLMLARVEAQGFVIPEEWQSAS